MWKWNSCGPYCDVINEILKLNKKLKDSEKIRVVSISQGMFSAWSDFADWKKTVEEAAGRGILIVTCDSKFLDYGTLVRVTDKNPDEPTSYKRGKYSAPGNVLLMPAGNRTIASRRGPEVYTFDREGGMSWAAPYLAGLAALAYQVDPEIEPDEIVKLWIETAVKANAGPVVNPAGFIEAVQKGKLK
jgi:serine protease AprX